MTCEQRRSMAAPHRSNTGGEKGLTHPSCPQLLIDISYCIFGLLREPGSPVECLSRLRFESAAEGLVWLPKLTVIAGGESSEL